MDMRVDHVSIAVHDIDTALAFFRSCLPIEMRVHKRQGYNDDFNWCDFYIGQFKLELIEAAPADSFVRRFIDKRGEGLHHLSLEVTQLEPLIERLERRRRPHRRPLRRRRRRHDRVHLAAQRARRARPVLAGRQHLEPERPQTVPFRLRSGETVQVRVDHVSMAVRSIDRTLDFFRRYFPIRAEHPKHRATTARFVLTTFTLNGYRIELIEPAAGTRGRLRRALPRQARRGLPPPLDRRRRLDPLLAQLEADGVRIVDQADIGGGCKTAFISPRSAHGVLIQFWQDPSLGR